MDPRFVGRSIEMDELVARLDDALGGRAGIALVAGEPGIGKTRLAAELSRLAGVRAVPTLWGGCTDEDGAPAYWPWRRIVRSWRALVGAEEAAVRLADGAAALGRIAPELAPTEEPPSPAAGPEQRFALFDVVAGFLSGIAADSGLVLVLDDVQWADPDSLALLAHVAREARHARLLLVATYRPAELAADPWRAAVVADLDRLPGAVHVELSGLGEPEVEAALAERLGTVPDPQVVAAVTRRTGGNPFFVGELGRALSSGSDAAALRVPAAVRDVIGRRLARLPLSCRALLGHAAVLGAEVDVVMVAAVGGLPADAVLDALLPAVDDGVLECPAGRPGLRFSHDLVRETLIAGLRPTERAWTHRRAVTVLEPSAADPDVLPVLARHALASLPLGDPLSAVRWARRAGELSMAQLAYEDAARLFVRAGEVGRGVLAPSERLELVIATADAQACAHDVGAAIVSCTAAADLARHIGDGAALGRAALVLQGVSEPEWLQVVRGWCEEALRVVPESDGSLRAQLLAQLAHTMLLSADAAEIDAASAAALDMAERLGDRSSLVGALRARQLACSGPGGNRERLALGGRMLDVAARSDDPDVAMWGHLWRFDALLQAGRIADAEAELDRLDPVVARIRRPLARLHLLRSRTAVHFAKGQFAEAGRLNDETMEMAERGKHRGAAMTARAIAFHLATFTGVDGLDVADLEDAAFLQRPYAALMRCTLGIWHLAFGRTAEAARWYEGLPEPGSARVPPFMGLVTEAFRSQLAADLRDRTAAERTYRYLLPHADLHVAGGAGATASHGSVQLYLGIAASTCDRTDGAVRHLRTAVAVNDAAGLAPFSALARFHLALALRARGRRADHDESAVALAEAGVATERLGMAPLRARITALATELRDGGVLSRRETEIAELVGQGLTNRQVAATVHISERTVETHVQHILAKLGFCGRSQIAAWVARARR